MPTASRRTDAVTLVSAAVVGAVFVLLAGLIVAPANVPFRGHGESFAAQAADPFSLVGTFPQRVLWPLLAWCAGQVGIGPVAFSQVCSGSLLATVFWFCRVRGARFVDALLITAAIAATGAVQLYQVMTCHSDSLNWLLLLLLVHHVQRPVLFWVLVLLSALSHEMTFFLTPWLVWLRRSAGGRTGREIGALSATGAAYWCWLKLVRSVGSSGGLDWWYYVTENWLVFGTLGFWCVWSMMVLVEFGPLLAVVVWAWRTDRLAMGGRAGPWIYVACVLSTMVFAYDVQRFSCFAFLPLVSGSIAFLEGGRRRAIFVALLVATIGAYAAFHWSPDPPGGLPYQRVSHCVLTMDAHAPGTRQRFFTHIVPHLWLETLAFVAFGATVVVGGLWLARRQERESRTIRNASP